MRIHPGALAVPALALLLSACASRIAYPADYPLTATLFSFRSAPVHGRIPQGWFAPAEDTLAPGLAAWLVAQDYSASLTIREIRLDERARAAARSEGLPFVARMSLAFRTAADTATAVTSPPQEFSAGRGTFSAYECRSQGIDARVAVFSAGGRYFECEAAPARRNGSPVNAGGLFRIQQSVLASLVF